MASLLRMIASPLTAALAWGLAALPAPGMAADCSVAPEKFLFEPMLTRLVTLLSTGKPVTIVAMGGASTEGRAGGGPDYAWPNQLGIALRREFPASAISIVNLGRSRQTAAAMFSRFGTDVIPHDPTLVVWETGTVDAVRNVDLDDFRDTLRGGITKLRPAAEVVMMDVQFSRLTHAMIDFEPYESALRQMADVYDVPLFPRNELMREWSESGEIDYGVKDKEQRQIMARKLYRCIGEALAVFVLRRPAAGDVTR